METIASKKIGFLGLGQMGGCLIKSFSSYLSQISTSSGINDNFFLFDPIENKRKEYKSLGFMNYMSSEEEVVEKAGIIFCCVKPDKVQPVLDKTSKYINSDSLLISIAAGLSINYMEEIYRNKSNQTIPKIIRIMTNHLCSINQGSNVYCTNNTCKKDDEVFIEEFLSNVGITKKVDEKLMNAYTALNGSGPAFVYHFIESLVDGALREGVDVHTAREFAVNVVYGSAKFLKESNEKNPNTIQYIVTTPSGTTIEGLNELYKNRFKFATMKAISAATERGKQIEKEKFEILKNDLKCKM